MCNSLLAPAVVSDKPLPENSAALSRLHAAISHAKSSPQPTPAGMMPGTGEHISGRVYEVEQNPLGLETMKLEFSSEGATLWLTFQGGRKEQHDVGLGGVPHISQGEKFDFPVGVRGRWESVDTFVLDYDSIANIDSYTLRLKFQGDDLRIDGMEASRPGQFVLKARVLTHASP